MNYIFAEVMMNSNGAELPVTNGEPMSVMEMSLLILLLLIIIVSFWRIFTKAGQPGIFSIIPFFNQYIICKICGYGFGMFILSFIPIVNIIVGIILAFKLSEKFGKGAMFGIGIFLLPIIFLPIIAFGKAKYKG